MSPRRLRVLSLDGGGVRGLSALVILRRLLCMVNGILFQKDGPIDALLVFDIVVGTSTGGLIALMMVKLGMTVDDCIEQYEILSREVFGKPHLIGKRTGGFGTTKYSGRRLRELVVALIKKREKRQADYKMEDTVSHPNHICSVVCRELENNYTRARRGDAFFLCSHRCRIHVPGQDYEDCEMADAARATSAAPTFFDPMRIMKKILVDGGYGETNNPSQDAWQHYTTGNEILQDDCVRWVNIGTGTRGHDDEPLPAKQGWQYTLLPNYITNIMHTIRDMEQIATDSEKTGRSMSLIANMNRKHLDFYRFSATKGVHAIALDDYRTIDNKELERLTNQYLDDPAVETDLKDVAQKLAEDYLEKQNSATAPSVASVALSESKLTSVRRLVTRQQPDNLSVPPSATRVPSMAGASEQTSDSSNAYETSTSTTEETDRPIPIGDTSADNTGVGDQFKSPEATTTEFGSPHRSSTF